MKVLLLGIMLTISMSVYSQNIEDENAKINFIKTVHVKNDSIWKIKNDIFFYNGIHQFYREYCSERFKK